MQIDESTDISDDAQLLVYVRYLGENTLEEEFLFCKALETTTRGEDMFALVDSFMNKEGWSGEIAPVFAVMELQLCWDPAKVLLLV